MTGTTTRPLRDPADLDPLIERIGDARVVAIGEASHGTHEYYAWRAQLTRRLIEERGFGFVAVEGDWPDCYRVNRSVKLRDGADDDPRDALDAFARWPTWMWANDEVVEFCRWLRSVNARRPAGERVGFYGLDARADRVAARERAGPGRDRHRRPALLRAVRRGRRRVRLRQPVRPHVLRAGRRRPAPPALRATGG